MLNSLLTIITIFYLICLAVVVLVSNSRSSSNRALASFIVVDILWLASSELIKTDIGSNLIFARFVFGFALLLGPSLGLFVGALTKQKSNVLRKSIGVSVVPIFALTVLTPLVIKDIEFRSGIPYPSYGPLFLLFITFVGVCIYEIMLYLNRARHIVGKVRNQAIAVFYGIVIFTVLALSTNLILPAILSNSTPSRFAPLGSVFLVTFLTYAIIKHGLFDIRLFVARAIGYILSAAFVGMVYTLLVIIIGDLLVGTETTTNSQKIFFGILTFIVAITYAPIIRFFNKLTNRLFYRDAYEPQSVISKVSNVAVGSIDPRKIQKESLAALTDALKPTSAGFLLMDGSEKLRQGDSTGSYPIKRDLVTLQTVLKKGKRRVVVYDELADHATEAKEVLRREDISVVSPLVTKDETIGYLVLGPKKSGNIYNSQDIGLLNIASNELAVALQNAQRFEEIQAFNITLQNKVTEATRELKATNRKLVALDEAKDEFISMASHQLRTPLTSIKGYLSMLVEGDLGKVTAAQDKAMREAFGSSQRMVYLIADFLNVSRIKTGKFVIEPKEVDLPQIVEEEITQLREMAQSRDLKLSYDQPEVFPRVMLDETKIRQVMMNLVDNAIYYTPSGGTIAIQLYSTGDEIIFKVIDTGIGVPKREQHKLFTKFFRAGNAKKARPDGTGLGLFMAQKIVVEQGGAIIFESTEGKGSTFGFRFPLKKIQPK